MKWDIAFLFLIMMCSHGRAQKSNSERDIRQMDRHNASTLVNNDTTALIQFLTEDFLLNTSGNRVSFGANQIISAIRSGRIRYLRFDVVSDTVYFINKKTAISMGSETAVFGSEGPSEGNNTGKTVYQLLD